MPRTIIKTETPGWYLDSETDKKIRKKDGDIILTEEEYAQSLIGGQPTEASSAPTEKQVEEAKAKKEASAQKIRDAAKSAQAETATLTTGKQVVGKTVVIKCAWVAPELRTPAQQEIFDGPIKDLTYDAVKKAAGGKRSAFPDGTERTIKVQDAFQVKFSPENQKAHRNERRRKNTAARRAEREAAKKA